MAKVYTIKVVTANDLLEGDVIYLTKSGEWTRLLEQAHPAVTQEQANTMLDIANAQHDKIVGPYLAEVSVDDEGKPQPVHFREEFRTRGPSNYFHGKQAE